ncbi:hypothetical protein ILUMI_17127 [Ignelater luminosus]|uniref:Uncharacterized protein n=1 Tax=Ignelater luminosus TaxID=2038154 RepID=A0A8K0CPZ8_IGNLU|nr:hypothetical protein ILUMI_17127 [Ignelater luminosus]
MASLGLGPVKLPPNFDMQGQNAATEWKFWKTSFEDYLTAIDQHEAPDKIKLSLLQNIIGTESASIMSTFTIPEAEMGKYDYNIGFNRKKEGESFKQFLTDLRQLVKSCNYNDVDAHQSAEDKALRDMILMGI